MMNNMSYYHYTSLKALNGILQNDKAGKKRLCFWATRYDCFEDKDEYLLGIDCFLQNMFKNLHSNLNVKDIANTITQEKSRLRTNNTVCYYREFYLPKESLLRIITLSNESKIQAGRTISGNHTAHQITNQIY